MKKKVRAKNLEQQKQEIDKIATNAVMQWSEDQAVSSFFKKQLGEEYENEGISTAQKLFKASVSKAIMEEKPEWTAMIFSNAAKGEEKIGTNNTQVNFYGDIDNQINENVSNLINVSDKIRTKSGIEKII